MNPKELQEFLKRELPDVSFNITPNLPKKTAGQFRVKEGKKSIHIHPDYKEDEKVIAHEIIHALEFNRKGKTSHRDRYFWENQGRKLGVDVVIKKMMGNRMVTTMMGQDIQFREPKKSGKYHLYCSSGCGWQQFSNRKNRFNQNVDKLRCPKCSSNILLEVK